MVQNATQRAAEDIERLSAPSMEVSHSKSFYGKNVQKSVCSVNRQKKTSSQLSVWLGGMIRTSYVCDKSKIMIVFIFLNDKLKACSENKWQIYKTVMFYY